MTRVNIQHIIVLFLSFIISCKNQSGLENNSIQGLQPATTALPINPIKNLPETFKLDSIFIRDDKNGIFATIFFPNSIDRKYSSLNTLVSKTFQSIIDKYYSGEIEYIEYYGQDSIIQSESFDSWISSFYKTNQLVSMCFVQQSYSLGAAHYIHGYITFNYDFIKDKAIPSTNFFLITPNNRNKFYTKLSMLLSPFFKDYSSNHIDSIINDTSLFEEYDEFIEVKVNYPNINDMKFYLVSDTIVFCFDDYELGPGMILEQLKVPKNKLKEFINPTYY